MKTAIVQTLWSKLLMGTLQRAGLRHAVVSPGSRSTPFVAALLEQPQIHVHSIIDERSAAFVALGLARSGGAPVLLVCTSGTAAANYFPAVVEANQSGIALVLLTADRPIEAQFANCPQTTDQVQLYGAHARRYVELGEAQAHPPALRALQRLVLSSVHLAQCPNPGPVHLNARARKPLEPDSPDSPETEGLARIVQELLEQTPSLPEIASTQAHSDCLREFAECCASTSRGLVVCGYDPQFPELDADVLARFSTVTGYPVWLDVAHPLRWKPPAKLAECALRCANLIWSAPELPVEYEPEVIVQVGSIPTSSHWESWLERAGARRHFLLARQGWPDPSGRATRVIIGDPSLTLRHAASLVAPEGNADRTRSSWFLACKRVDTLVSQTQETFIRSEPAYSELRAVRSVLEACPAGARIVLGNSLPIRDADLVWPCAERAQHAFAIRGTNGIDGVVSTAVGVALEGRVPVLLLLGDISFLHDIGGLYAARNVESPLAIVVIDNGGGRIFEQLPIAASTAARHLEHWTTPHSLNIEAAGAVYGIDVKAPSDSDQLRNDVAVALTTPKATLVCIRVDPASARRGTLALRASVLYSLNGSPAHA